VGSGEFGGGGSIGESSDIKHDATSEEKFFYKEVIINKHILNVDN